MLTRYWFVFFPEDRFGARNIGVTAFSEQEAKSIIKENLRYLDFRFDLKNKIENHLDEIEVIKDIDIRLLDKGHVMPGIGVVSFKGIWFPRFNI